MNTRLLFPYLYISYVRILNLVEKYQPTYNPNNFKLFVHDSPRRNTEDRVKFIEKNLDFKKIGSFLDIGSLFGYFVFRLAEKRKIFGQGMDISSIYTAYSRAIADLNEIENVSFTTMKLTKESVNTLPKYDLILFLNVFHHIVHFEGFPAADKIMKTLAKKCRYFVFETGIFTEKGEYWSDDLAFMGKYPELWIREYLGKLGFSIIAVKNFSTHLNSIKRPMFICKAP